MPEDPQKQADFRALEIAKGAEARAEEVARSLAKHEDGCDRRYGEITKKFERLTDSMLATDTKRSGQFTAVHDKIDAGFASLHKKMDAKFERRDTETNRWRTAAYLGLIAVLCASLGALIVLYVLPGGGP